MNELQSYYENYCRVPSLWSHPDSKKCGCRGGGWFLSELDTFHECPHHYEKGQPHPEEDSGAAEAWYARKAMLAAGWSSPVVVEAPPRMKVGERFGTPVYAPVEEDDIPF